MCGSGSRTLLNTDPIRVWIWIHNTAVIGRGELSRRFFVDNTTIQEIFSLLGLILKGKAAISGQIRAKTEILYTSLTIRVVKIPNIA